MICTSCKQDKPKTFFYERYTECKECQREKRKEKRRKKKATTKSKSVTIEAETVKMKPSSEVNPPEAPTAPSNTYLPTEASQASQKITKNREDYILEKCKRLNRCNNGKVLREYQAEARNQALTIDEDVEFFKYLDALEVYLDSSRHDNLKAEAKKVLDNMRERAS